MSGAARPTQALFKEARAGSAAAYEALFERLAGRLLHYIRLRIGEAMLARSEPEDLLQEAYTAVHAGFSRLGPDDEKGFVRWVYQVDN